MSVAVTDRPTRRPGPPVRHTEPEAPVTPQTRPATAEQDLVRRLRAGDAAAFTGIVRSWSPAMLHVARTYVSSHASAEEAVQETWLAVIKGLDGFEGRSTLRTWTFHVLANIARRQGVRERRTVAVGVDGSDGGRTVDPARFRPAGEPWEGGWRAEAAPRSWGPESSLLSKESLGRIAVALDRLPPRQRVVLQLRDVDGLGAEEVCDILDLSSANQRVLLHRARARLRQELEDHADRSGEETR